MKKLAHVSAAIFALSLLSILPSKVFADGSGSLKLGWVTLNDEGNRSVAYRTFNEYEGGAVSLENLRYRFSSGQLLRADLKNVTLNNRNLSLNFRDPGRYGISFYNSQYRRIYSFDGDNFTRRNRTGGLVEVYPHKKLKLYAGMSGMGIHGHTVDLYGINGVAAHSSPDNPAVKLDYSLTTFNGGFDMVDRGGVLRGEYRTTKYKDHERPDRDQTRKYFSTSTAFPIPTLEWVMVEGGYRRFQSEYDTDNFEIWSDFGWGGATLTLPKNFTFRYNLYFDRSASDSDFVATDNIANAFYLGYDNIHWGGATVGYQYDINDDFYNEVHANSVYFSGWLKPVAHTEFRAQVGNRAEDVKTGSRLIGNEDRARYSFSGKYRVPGKGEIRLKYERRHRKNDDIGTEVTFNRFLADVTFMKSEYGSLSGGYSYSTGDYSDIDNTEFIFHDHLLYGDVTTREYHQATLGFGAIYYRSKRDLDVESFSLRFTGSYRFADKYRFDIEYNVHNFDDYLVIDNYYTENIVELSISRDFTL